MKIFSLLSLSELSSAMLVCRSVQYSTVQYSTVQLSKNVCLQEVAGYSGVSLALEEDGGGRGSDEGREYGAKSVLPNYRKNYFNLGTHFFPKEYNTQRASSNEWLSLPQKDFSKIFLKP